MTNAKKGAFAVAIVALLCLLPSIWFFCQVAYFWIWILLASLNAIDRDVAQRSGCEKIPQVRQIETLFGKGDHFITGGEPHLMPGGANDICQWSTDVYFAGRYQLTMWVDIEIDRRNSEVSRVVDTLKFRLLEVTRVDMLSDGRPSISYGGSGQREFSAADWKKVVEAKGDFSVIGIQIRNDAPIANFDELMKWSQSRSQQQ